MAQTICFEAFPRGKNIEKMRRTLMGEHGFIEKQNGNGIYFYVEVPASDAWITQTVLKRHGYYYNKYDLRYARGSSYRKDYFATHAGPYRCAYCGRKLKKEDVEVDHLIPVSQAKKNSNVRAFLQIFGIRNVNDTKNLVAACHKCNSHKSDKMGLWVIKGVIGRYKNMWTVIWIFRILLVAAIGCFVYYGIPSVLNAF